MTTPPAPEKLVGDSGVAQGKVDSDADKLARLPSVLGHYAKAIRAMNERGDWPVDSDLAPILQRASEALRALSRPVGEEVALAEVQNLTSARMLIIGGAPVGTKLYARPAAVAGEPWWVSVYRSKEPPIIAARDFIDRVDREQEGSGANADAVTAAAIIRDLLVTPAAQGEVRVPSSDPIENLSVFVNSCRGGGLYGKPEALSEIFRLAEAALLARPEGK